MRKKLLENQISVFDNPAGILQSEMDFWLIQSQRIKNIVESEGIESYLKKGEKILSLARQKAKRKEFVASPFMECFNFKVLSAKTDKTERMQYILQCIQNKFIAPAMENPLDEQTGLLSLFPWIREELQLQKVQVHSYEDKVMRGLVSKKKKSTYQGALALQTGDLDTVYMPIGQKNRLSKKQNGKRYYMLGSHNIQVVDGPLYLAHLVLLFQLRERVQEILASFEQVEDNVVYHHIQKMQADVLATCCMDEVIYLHPRCLNKRYISSYLDKHKVKYEECNENHKLILTEREFFYEFIVSSEVTPSEWVFQQDMQEDGVLSLSGNIKRNGLLSVFEKLFSEYIIEKQEDEFQKALEAEYAHSYETKHNIPERILNAMERSGWNEYFGYVEFDEDCDLDKLNELVKEFTALSMLFNWGKKEAVALRFRKLGKYKAGGLYFSSLKCLCVDIRCPSSLAHEYFHMLDYEADSASRKAQFSLVYEKYCSLLESYAMKAGNEHVLNGKTKYNLSYYTRHSEVFARCGELYLVRIKGVDNSLVKPEGGFAYPMDEELDRLIEEYYTQFLGGIYE